MKKRVSLLLAALLMLASLTPFAVAQPDKATVRQVQQALNAAGYSCGTPDGIAGKKTYAAIRQYRSDNGLEAGEAIDGALLEALGLPAPGGGAEPDEAAESAVPEAPPHEYTEEEWQAFTLVPKHFEIFDKTLRFRVACEDVPVQALWQAKDKFSLIRDDGSDAIPCCQVRVMEAPLYEQSLYETADYFDVVFAIPEAGTTSSGSRKLRLWNRDFDVPPLGRNDVSNCCFVTNDGAYVVSLYTEDAYKAVDKLYREDWKGKDIELILSGKIFGAASNDYSVNHLLNNCGASTIRLVLSEALKPAAELKEPKKITELTVATQYVNHSYPNVKKMTVYIGEYTWTLPKFGECAPNLTELNIACCRKYDAENNHYMSESKTLHENVCRGLKTLNITSPEESPFTSDPYVRTWLTAQAKATPSAKINGVKASTIDFTADLSDEAKKVNDLPAEYEALKKIYKNSIENKKLTERDVTLEDLVAPLYIAVMKDDGAISCTSTEVKPGEDMSIVPKELLAETLGEAATIVMIYPTYEKIGVYQKPDGTKFSDALKCYTNMAILKYDSGKAKAVSYQVVETDSPPKVLQSGSAKGTYVARRGIQLIAKMLK